MTGAAIRWLRRVWPPTWAIALVLLPLAVVEGLYFWLRSFAPQEATEFLTIRDAMVITLMGIFGAYRVYTSHPLCDADYLKWLMLTPWSYPRQLPLRPIFPAMQDVLALALAVIAMHGSALPPRLWVVAAFLLSYTVFIGLILFAARIWVEAYLLAFGLGLAVHTAAWDREAAVVLVAVLFAIALSGLRRSLKAYPWDESVEKARKKLAPAKDQHQTDVGTGWPFDYLNPQAKHPGIPRVHGVLVSLLAGWWFYVLQNLGPSYDLRFQDTVRDLFYILSGVPILVRAGAYCLRYWSPISLWGRIRTGRWIIPGYDYVFIAPLCAATALLAGCFLTLIPLPQGPVLASSFALVLMICLTMGPSLERWRLTGNHRLPTLGMQARDFERV